MRSSEKFEKSRKVACYNSRQAQQLRECTRFCDVEVSAADDVPVSTIKGVIGGIDLDVTEPELLEELSDLVTCVKRINRRVNGKQEPTRSVLLTFSTAKLPETVYLGYEKRKVSEFRPRVTRCFNCQKFCHSATICHEKVRCSRCGKNHKSDECPNKDTPKCANCGGRHSAAYQGCEKYKTAKSIPNLKNDEN